MTRRDRDAAKADLLGSALDLAAHVAAVRLGLLPDGLDPELELALVLLAELDSDYFSALLEPPEELLEAAGRCLHDEVRVATVKRVLEASVERAHLTKGKAS